VIYPCSRPILSGRFRPLVRLHDLGVAEEVRDWHEKCLNVHQFASLAEVQVIASHTKRGNSDQDHCRITGYTVMMRGNIASFLSNHMHL
jgi:hypothetical protein